MFPFYLCYLQVYALQRFTPQVRDLLKEEFILYLILLSLYLCHYYLMYSPANSVFCVPFRRIFDFEDIEYPQQYSFFE
jgi:hypothetical protein